MHSEEKKMNMKFHILAIVCIILFCVALTPITLQNDTFYTIRIGELILNNGIDMQDHFSWHENLPYTYPHWAYDTGIYLIYHLGEITGIPDGGMLFIYLSTVLLCCILGIVIYITNIKFSKNNLVSLLFTLLAMYLLKDFIAARAQLVTFILFALTILYIEKFLDTSKKRYAIYLIIISLIVANVHIAVWPFFFVLFMPYIAEYIIASLIEMNIISKLILFFKNRRIKKIEKKLNKSKTDVQKNEILIKIEKLKEDLFNQKIKEEKIIAKAKERRNSPYKIEISKNKTVKWLILVMIICILTGLLTPLGDSPYTYLAKTMQGNTMKSISEHQPLTLYNNKNILIFFALIIAMLTFTKTKITLKELFMVVGLMYLTLMTRRQASMLIIIVGFIFAKWLSNLFDKYDKEGKLKLMKFINTWFGKTITIFIVIICCLAVYKPKKNSKFINTSNYPVEASTWILENLNLENIKLFNEYNYGSYLLYRGIPVFIDSRADLYAPEFNKTKEEEGRDIFSDYINTSSIGNYYENKMEEYDISHVILQNNSKLNIFISRDNNYKQIYKDDYFVIYERNTVSSNKSN